MSTTPSGVSVPPLRSGYVEVSPVFDIVLTAAERALFEALDAGTTQDLDLWFGRIDDQRLREAAHKAGGFYTSGFGLQPPALGGDGLDRVDVVLTASGLESFDREFACDLVRWRKR